MIGLLTILLYYLINQYLSHIPVVITLSYTIVLSFHFCGTKFILHFLSPFGSGYKILLIPYFSNYSRSGIYPHLLVSLSQNFIVFDDLPSPSSSHALTTVTCTLPQFLRYRTEYSFVLIMAAFNLTFLALLAAHLSICSCFSISFRS